MRLGISGSAIDVELRYAKVINGVCFALDFWPKLAYAIACNETILGDYAGKWNALTVVSEDNGHGLFQLTSSWPPQWQDGFANGEYAIDHFLNPQLALWQHYAPEILGPDLVRCLAASFNAGFGGAWKGHQQGNVDLYTTDNYGARALAIYEQLVAGTFVPPS